LIGEEVLERYGSLPHESDGKDGAGLARLIAPILSIPVEEVRQHLHPLLRDENIRLTSDPGGGLRWTWASS
jgi:hypothetical protein